MDEQPNPGAVLTALTTEHFTLQGATSTARSEAAARSTIYLGTVTGALVALGFIGNATRIGHVFRLFALAVLPTLFFLGLVTFIRLVDLAVEDLQYQRAINRIRHYYLEISGEYARYFLLSGHDDIRGVMTNTAFPASPAGRYGPRQVLFTAATGIALVDSVVAGSGVALLLGAEADLSSDLATGLGVLTAALLAAGQVLYERHRGVQLETSAGVLFPSP